MCHRISRSVSLCFLKRFIYCIILCVFMGMYLYAHVHVYHTSAWWPQRSEEGIRFPETEVTDGPAALRGSFVIKRRAFNCWANSPALYMFLKTKFVENEQTTGNLFPYLPLNMYFVQMEYYYFCEQNRNNLILHRSYVSNLSESTIQQCRV